MKKIVLFATFVAALFTSCTESDYEFHQTYFSPQVAGGKVLYADQTTDSTRVISYDPWTATTEFENGATAWFTISPTECNFIAGEQFASTRMNITTTPNTSEKIRSGHIVVKSFDTVGMPVKQTTWLNIIRPFGEAKNYDSEGALLPEEDRKMTFAGTTIATANQFEIEFTVYADGATLTADADWLKPATTSFAAGTHTVAIVVEENQEVVQRTANLTLTSNGISTPITITQAKANDK